MAWCRRRARRLTVGIVVVLLLVTGCSSGSSSPDLATQSSKPFPSATRAKLQAIVDEYLHTTTAPGVLVGIWSPQGTWVSAAGISDLSTGARTSRDMQYQIASQTKTFTADVVLQLIGEHKVSFDDRLDKWMGGIPNGTQITVRQLLNHTSGYGDTLLSESALDEKMRSGGCTEAELLAPPQPLFPPGTKFEYSNYGYALLGRIAELATGKSLSTLIRERITEPLHLTRTYLPELGGGLTAPYLHGYSSTEAEPSPIDTSAQQSSTCGWAFGGLVSTLTDMRVWSVALGTGKLLEPSVWAEARRDQVPIQLTPVKFMYGLGFSEISGYLGHDGTAPGYNSATFYSPSLHTSVAVVDNGMSDATKAAAQNDSISLTLQLAATATGRSLPGVG